MREKLKGRKTYILAGLMFLHALVQVAVGDMPLAEFFNSAQLWEMLNALGFASLRAGVAKEGLKNY